MALFEVWNPHLIAPRTLRLDLTEAEAGFGDHDADALIAASAAAVGAGEVASWQRRAVRTPYYSWYRDEDEAWVDRWPIVWQLRLELTAERPLAPIPRTGRFALDEVGPSSGAGGAAALDDDANAPCVVLAAFRDQAAADAAIAPGMIVERGVAMGRFPSLAIELGVRDEAFFAGGALEAEALVAQLAAAGGTVNQRDTFVWFVGREQ